MESYYEPFEFTWNRDEENNVWINYYSEDSSEEEKWNNQPLTYWFD